MVGVGGGVSEEADGAAPLCAELHVLLQRWTQAHDPAPTAMNKGEGAIKFSSEPLYYPPHTHTPQHHHHGVCTVLLMPPFFLVNNLHTNQYNQHVLRQQHCTWGGGGGVGRVCASAAIKSASVFVVEELSLYIELCCVHQSGRVYSVGSNRALLRLCEWTRGGRRQDRRGGGGGGRSLRGWPTCVVVSLGFSVVAPCCQKLLHRPHCCWRSGPVCCRAIARLAGPLFRHTHTHGHSAFTSCDSSSWLMVAVWVGHPS